MAFMNRCLGVVCCCNNWSNWVYNDRQESTADMEKHGYFNEVISLVNTGDLITLVGSDTVKQKYIFINNGEVVLMELGK